MERSAESRGPHEEELEDGEICDDEPEERAAPARLGDGRRPPGCGARAARARKHHPHHLGPLPPPEFRLLGPYGPVGPMGPGLGPFPPQHRQQCGPSGPDRPPSPLPLPPHPHPHPHHGEPSPRSSFWERSHGALGRFRHRSLSGCGRGVWSRGNRPPPGRYGPNDPGTRTDSPNRKRILTGSD